MVFDPKTLLPKVIFRTFLCSDVFACDHFFLLWTPLKNKVGFMLFLFLHLFLFFLLSSLYWFQFRSQVEGPKGNLLIEIQNAGKHWKETPHLVLVLAFILFLLLPLVIGFQFYLRSDANVLVVIVWIIWAYNWSKYSFFRE
ncbi:LIC10362 family protein [Leptospira levettii]|uniref:LIC10362 family protein n=2 Tax=Leptospira levettii TaxID=2023178 RepID=UPI003CCFF38C